MLKQFTLYNTQLETWRLYQLWFPSYDWTIWPNPACCQGRPSPLRPWCISPLFQISPPYFRQIFRHCGKFSKFYLIQKNFLIFIRQNFWWPFLVIDHKFRISPYFSCFSTFPLCFTKIIILLFPPYFEKFPPCFRKIHLLFTYFMCILFPPYVMLCYVMLYGYL